ncbi:hypothetical protein GCM10010168_85700 [Actinoplanes ianthinogenes]|uniref:Uncharacterized protein n=1 Tax=Actinoplanes ianthinogenes TaxID=122358 RepID=A0ABM7M123_9ACTN|nr:hypothetical protein [Actinoplanes ianthinogenes]BCJ45301.1 hypothetical protein Aiant_59580 [Actinoplanes ianthinogenes]GGR53654.1 hypothetical protein GCM10010168_85700 [Actinoplanes ianthinogenes]
MSYYEPAQAPYIPSAQPSGPPVSPVTPAPPAAPRRTGAILGALVAGIAIGAAATAGGFLFLADDDQPTAASAAPATMQFGGALQACEAGNGSYPGAQITDSGKTLILSTSSSQGISVQKLGCVLGKLGAPASVLQHVDTTRALDGQQTDTWPGVSARWTYHPDAGLQMTITKA